LGSDYTTTGFQTTKSYPNSNGISFNPNPTELKFMLFRNLKGLQIMGKRGGISSPLPSRMAVNSLIEIEDQTADDEVFMRRRLSFGTIAEDELLLPVKELLAVAIEAGS